MNIVFLHGLNNTANTFNYIIDRLTIKNASIKKITYNTHNRISTILEEVIPKLPRGKFCLVGHSLGGVVATLIASKFPDRTQKLVTISSPLRGSKAAQYLMLIPGHLKIMEDLAPNSSVMRRISRMQLDTPTLSLISTRGHFPIIPILDEPNDGVVAISSQKGLSFAKKIELDSNHFEILLNLKTIEILNSTLGNK